MRGLEEFSDLCEGCKKSLISDIKFRKELAGYAVDCILYALGRKRSIVEPTYHGFELSEFRNAKDSKDLGRHDSEHRETGENMAQRSSSAVILAECTRKVMVAYQITVRQSAGTEMLPTKVIQNLSTTLVGCTRMVWGLSQIRPRQLVGTSRLPSKEMSKLSSALV